MRATVTDRNGFSVQSHRKVTEEGYLEVPARVSRTGVYTYLAGELGLEGRDPHDIVGVYRDASDVFSPESLASFDDVPVTVEHPTQMVDSKTFRQHAVGHSTSAGRVDEDGNHVVVNLRIADQDAIDAIMGGKAEVSPGYSAEYVPEKGEHNGQPYEFRQRDIRINHVAIVDRGRGLTAKLFDHAKGAKMATITFDGRTVSMDDESKAALIQSSFDALQKRVKDSEAKEKQLEEEIEALEAKIDAKEEALEAEKAKTTEDALSGRISEILSVRDSAIKLAGDKFSCKSMDSVEVKRAALQMVRPKRDWSDKSAAYVSAAFDEAMESKEEEDEKDESKRKESSDHLAQFGRDVADARPEDAQSAREAAHKAFLDARYNRGAK